MEVIEMNRTCIAAAIIFLLLGGYSCGRSDEKSEVGSKVKEEVGTLANKVSGEVKKLEEDYKVLEAEKDYEKALEEEPKAPAEAMGEEGALLGEEFEPLE
jgi:Skp family chaperone for outer membrane proteins